MGLIRRRRARSREACRVLVSAGYFPALGGFKWPKFQGPDAITQFIDHVSYIAGKHSMKFGGELHHNDVTNARLWQCSGSITSWVEFSVRTASRQRSSHRARSKTFLPAYLLSQRWR